MRTWTKLAPAVLLALPLTLAPARAADELTTQKIEQIQKDLNQLRRDVERLSNELKTSDVQGAAIRAELLAIRGLLENMSRQQQEIVTRRAAYYGLPAEGGVAAGTGTITIENQYPATATVRVNGRPYVIPPYRTIPVACVPLGTYTYDVEVDGYGIVQPMQTETLRGGRRITIFPR